MHVDCQKSFTLTRACFARCLLQPPRTEPPQRPDLRSTNDEADTSLDRDLPWILRVVIVTLPSSSRQDQDPRYFYQGTGSKRSRTFHALANAFMCKGNNGKWEPNYSNVGGDLAAGAISNLYYPRANRGTGIVFQNALIAAGGRMANGLVQEFILRRFTSRAGSRTPEPKRVRPMA